jgi:hypothetical protein
MSESRTEDPSEEALFQRYREMSGNEKLEIVGRLGRLVDEIALAEIRERHPEGTERENRLRLASRTVDRETMIRAFGWDPIERGY